MFTVRRLSPKVRATQVLPISSQRKVRRTAAPSTSCMMPKSISTNVPMNRTTASQAIFSRRNTCSAWSRGKPCCALGRDCGQPIIGEHSRIDRLAWFLSVLCHPEPAKDPMFQPETLDPSSCLLRMTCASGSSQPALVCRADEHPLDIGRVAHFGVILRVVADDPSRIGDAPERAGVVGDAVKDLKRHAPLILDGLRLQRPDE